MSAVLSRLYRDHFDVLRAYLARRLNCQEAGREAAQDIFVRLLAKPPRDVLENPRGFLLKVARNFAIDIQRAEGCKPIEVAAEEYAEALPDAASDPARIAEARQSLRALADEIAALPPKCRDVFCLHRIDGLAHAEIADRLGISTKMVEKHLARAGQTLTRPHATSSGSKRVLRAAVLAGVAVLCAWLGLPRQDDRITTASGQPMHLRLADGSELDVAPNTRLLVKFHAGRRRLELEEGQIVVTVAPDPLRPFEVLAGGAVIRDIGTRFDVRSGAGRTRVTVAEGLVEIDLRNTGAVPLRIGAGESAEFDGRGVYRLRQVDAAAELGWTRGQLSFDAVPLADVVEVLNRYRKTPIELSDSVPGNIRISGVFLIGDELAVLRAIERVAPIRFVPGDGRIVARRSG